MEAMLEEETRRSLIFAPDIIEFCAWSIISPLNIKTTKRTSVRIESQRRVVSNYLIREAMSTKKKDLQETYTFKSISSSHLIFMQMSSFLPLNGKSFSHPLSLLLQLWDHLIVIMYNMMWQGYGIRMILRGEVEIDFLCEDIITTGFTMRYILLCMNRQQLCSLIKFCERLWNLLGDSEAIFVRHFERKAYYFRNFFMCNLTCMASLYIITAYFVRLPPLEANGTERRTLPFRFFMDVQEEPAYSLVFASHVFVIQFVTILLCSTETVSLYLIMMASGYLRTVQNQLLSLKGSDDDSREKGEATYKYVTNCAYFHQQILIFCEDIERMTRALFFFACFCPIYNVSITGIVLLNTDDDKVKFAPILIYNFFQFFLCQWAPEHLAEESAVIAESAYFASLQPLAPSHREKINRILYFMMMRAQRPVQLTAGGFAPLCIETFGTMTRSALSFFMVLRNFRT